ncbi:Aste57867_12846 [Aphanomyces stellatus]|uniref:Aste57867_12846 protein n=1 Tax=Aphanomyces stellatus TaxID=120398 RepID=A0A485KXB3_9STRA|nr:hypothetical protein As57867_012798 [Aphanomyces stellatus]VFT89693.1 Aste57867_12846 [Aphanomyces stellatus]
MQAWGHTATATAHHHIVHDGQAVVDDEETILAHHDHHGDVDEAQCKGCRALLTENQLLRELLLRTSTDAQQIINAFEKQMDFQRQRFEVAGGLKNKGPARKAGAKPKASGTLSQPITPDVFRKLSHAAAQELVKVHPEYKELYDIAVNSKGGLFERLLNSDVFTEEQKRKQLQLSLLRQVELNDMSSSISPKSKAVVSPKAAPHVSVSQISTTSKATPTSPKNVPRTPEATGENYYKIHSNFSLSLRKQ